MCIAKTYGADPQGGGGMRGGTRCERTFRLWFSLYRTCRCHHPAIDSNSDPSRTSALQVRLLDLYEPFEQHVIFLVELKSAQSPNSAYDFGCYPQNRFLPRTSCDTSSCKAPMAMAVNLTLYMPQPGCGPECREDDTCPLPPRNHIVGPPFAAPGSSKQRRLSIQTALQRVNTGL
jgi:hypothetical protein